MIAHLRPALVIFTALTLLTGLVYPAAMTGIAATLFPRQAGGSLVERDGVVVGSALLGQSFASPRYFHGRPSATTAPDPQDATKTAPSPYNASNSMGSNLGPTNPALIERVRAEIAALKAENPGAPVPPDLVTTSASGLDPHVSPEAAAFQVPRVARAWSLPEAVVQRLVADHTAGRLAGLLGEPRVDVLALNLALDAASRR
jgi:K+-transporting ATPase ATPase C chain